MTGIIQLEIDKFCDAAQSGDVNYAQELLDMYGKRIIDEHNKTGRHALGYAAWFERHEMIEFLLAHGANIDVQDTDGMTALMRAAGWASFGTVMLLLDRGAETGIRDKIGRDALQIADDLCHLANKELIRERIEKKRADNACKDQLEKLQALHAPKLALRRGP